jgi:hypothetical protein
MSEPRSSIRGLLHDVNDELSVAVMELELLLEGAGLDGAARESLAGSLDACRRAAESLKQVWRELGPSTPGGRIEP